jgi:dephospho-CoA kinase
MCDVVESGPAVLHPYNPAWPELAAQLIAQLRRLRATRDWKLDHIGSTAVPGLLAKNVIDLQARVTVLPSYDELDRLLGPLGYQRARGARADSPGVFRDIPRGSEPAGDEVWEKRLYLRPGDPRSAVHVAPGDPLTVLHIRRSDSPFGRYTVWFRDWLRAHDEERDRYAATKTQLAASHARDADYDDYTRSKTAYLDEVQPAFVRWARKASSC